MTPDPWDRFTAEASGHDRAGYFESRPQSPSRAGEAIWFTRAEELRKLEERADEPASTARAVDRFLRLNPRGACVGYVGFDAVGLFEPTLRRRPAGDPFPLGAFALVRRPTRARTAPRRRPRRLSFASAGRPLSDSLPRARYGRSVRRLVEEIRNGESYQVVLAHRRSWRRPEDLISRAGDLRASERFAYFYYLRFDDLEIVGATPESVVEVDGPRASINPIAGTIPLGPSRRRRASLRVDPKELAEHRMLVDLARNDLGAVGRPGTVRIRERERLERFARLSHLVSRVETALRPRVGPWEVLAAAFPAGTVVGAPKIRATQLLRREERTWRGVYAGAIGLLTPGGRARWALGIRTAFAAGDRLYTAAGAGIVQRSQPGREYDETLVKLAQVESALVGGRR